MIQERPDLLRQEKHPKNLITGYSRVAKGEPGSEGAKGAPSGRGFQLNYILYAFDNESSFFFQGELVYLFMSPKWLLDNAKFYIQPTTATATALQYTTNGNRRHDKLFEVRTCSP